MGGQRLLVRAERLPWWEGSCPQGLLEPICSGLDSMVTVTILLSPPSDHPLQRLMRGSRQEAALSQGSLTDASL